LYQEGDKLKSIVRFFKELRRTLKVVKSLSESSEKWEVDIFVDLQRLLVHARILMERGEFEKQDLKRYQKDLPQELHPLLQKLWILMNSPLGGILLRAVEKILEQLEKLNLL